VVEGQHPLAAVLGCADSRVPVELLFDSGFGDLFVVRNAGTMSTTAAIASLEYAVGHLNVPLILVLGHEACGAVSAALHPEFADASLAQAVGQLRMELLQYGDHLSLEESCRRHTLSAAGNLVHSSVLLTNSATGWSPGGGGRLLRPAQLRHRLDGPGGADLLSMAADLPVPN
jgi:carbonic anhydrase